MTGVDTLLIATVVIALGFDFTNGFHDTANAVATSISTRALGPRTAVAMSAAFNLLGALIAIEILHTHVANTIGGLVAPKHGVSLGMIIAALVGAIVWNLITWRLGLPSSSSHALIGALIGMGVVAYGVDAVNGDPWFLWSSHWSPHHSSDLFWRMRSPSSPSTCSATPSQVP